MHIYIHNMCIYTYNTIKQIIKIYKYIHIYIHIYLTIYGCASDLAFGETPGVHSPGTQPLFYITGFYKDNSI